jgi:hypothetical protein
MNQPLLRRDILRFFDEAVRAEAHVPTPENIEVNMFVDGSYDSTTNIGGFAVVFKDFVPKSTTKQEIVKIAYQMPDGLDSITAEACAVAESLVLARRQVVSTVKALAAADPGSPTGVLNAITQSPVVVNIFSDCCWNMEFFGKPNWEGARKVSRNKIIERCFIESHKILAVSEIPGLIVKLNMAWVPAHKPPFEVDLHVMADRAAVKARKTGSFQMIGKDEWKISYRFSVYGPVQHYFVADAALSPELRPQNKKRRREDEDLAPEAEGKLDGQDRPEVESANDFVQPPRKKKKGFRVRTSEKQVMKKATWARENEDRQTAPILSDGFTLYLTREGIERYPMVGETLGGLDVQVDVVDLGGVQQTV